MRLVIHIQRHQLLFQTIYRGKLRETLTHPLSDYLAWQSVLEAYFKEYETPRAVDVRLGAPYVQWLACPWPSHLPKRADLLAYLEYQAAENCTPISNLQSASAAEAVQWQVCIDPRARVGDALLAAVIEQHFLNQLKAVLSVQNKSLSSLQPLALSAWQSAMKKSVDHSNHDAVFGLAEAEWLTLFGVQKSQITSVRVTRIVDGVTQAEGLAKQYAQSLGLPPDGGTMISMIDCGGESSC